MIPLVLVKPGSTLEITSSMSWKCKHQKSHKMSKGFYLAKLDLALLQMPGQAEKRVWREVSQDLREFLLYFHDEIMMRMQPGRELV